VILAVPLLSGFTVRILLLELARDIRVTASVILIIKVDQICV
jgi:hypothetical protein